MPPRCGKTYPAASTGCKAKDNIPRPTLPLGCATPSASSTGSPSTSALFHFLKAPLNTPATGVSSISTAGTAALSSTPSPAATLPTIAPPPTGNVSRDEITPQAAQNGPSGVKRRLGMGRSGTGYSNKKFKMPT
ncbi:hypothetical protein BDQ17DRAFT_679372 [Cyathus striatus]|nr:hypothetical protein BDQ17DRAFT_679372 [Cyathus striatus]